MIATDPTLLTWALPGDIESVQAFSRLVVRLRTGAASALVGAGAVACCGFPTWDGLLKELGAEIEPAQVRHMLESQKDLLWRAEEYRNRLQDRYYAFLQNRFGQRESLPRLVRELLTVNFKHCFTTNYDRSLEDAHRECFHEAPVELNWSDRDHVREFLNELSEPDTPRHYVHLHGVYNRPQEIVLTYQDYVKHYLQDDAAVERLFVLFATQHFVFIGFSLEDPDFVQILRQVNSRLGRGKMPAHYAILAADKPEETLIERNRLRGKYDIDPIFYDDRQKNHVNLSTLITALNIAQDATGVEDGARAGMSAPPEITNAADPQKGRWGRDRRRNGRELAADVTEVKPGWYRVEIRVRGAGPSELGPLKGEVIFHLHDTFDPQDREVEAVEGVARLTVHAYGAFTVGAEADGGQTKLEYDLASENSYPLKFRLS